MSRSCRNTREQASMVKAQLNKELARIAERIEWTGNIEVHHPVYQDTDSLRTEDAK